MLKLNLSVLLIGISLYSGALALQRSERDLSWDILVFAQNWPETVCKIYLEQDHSHTCRYPHRRNAWTVHGIWPTKIGTKRPSYCNDTAVFDPKKIKSIEKELEEIWTNVHGDTLLDGFWAYEWEKHGTCALSLKALDTEYKYFLQAITWTNKYYMTDVLNKAKIIPSNTINYKVEDFDGAIKKILGVKPFIGCVDLSTTQYLKELRICFDKELNLIDCVSNYPKPAGSIGSDLITDCNATRSIVYPEVSKRPRKFRKILDIDY